MIICGYFLSPLPNLSHSSGSKVRRRQKDSLLADLPRAVYSKHPPEERGDLGLLGIQRSLIAIGEAGIFTAF